MLCFYECFYYIRMSVIYEILMLFEQNILWNNKYVLSTRIFQKMHCRFCLHTYLGNGMMLFFKLLNETHVKRCSLNTKIRWKRGYLIIIHTYRSWDNWSKVPRTASTCYWRRHLQKLSHLFCQVHTAHHRAPTPSPPSLTRSDGRWK